MRLFVFGIAAAVAASAPAQAEWKQHKDDRLGVYNYFPVEPVTTLETYKAPLAKEAPATVLTAIDDSVTYKVEVVDFTKRAAEGANLLEEALNHEAGGRGGSFTVTDYPAVG
jgi:hypothetical protein